MKSAGKEEKSIAIKKGNCHQDVPAIVVIVDAGYQITPLMADTK